MFLPTLATLRRGVLCFLLGIILLSCPAFGQAVHEKNRASVQALARLRSQEHLYMLRRQRAHAASHQTLPQTFSAQDSNLTRLGHWAEGPCVAVAANGPMVYYGNGNYFMVGEASNLNQPVEKGRVLLPGAVRGIALRKHLAYVAANNTGLRLIDVSNPSLPIEVGSLVTGGFAEDVAAVGDYAYMADGIGLSIVDVRNPAAPALLSFAPSNWYANGIALNGNYAYLADNEAGVQIIDISNPAEPKVVGLYDSPGSARKLVAIGNLLYLADDFSFQNNATPNLRIIDVSIPAAPLELAEYAIDFNANGLAVRGDYAYVATGFTGLFVINISSPASLKLEGTLMTTQAAQNVALAGDTLYLANQGNLQIVDASAANNPVARGSLATGNYVWDAAAKGNYAYLALDNDGLGVIDISAPQNPKLVGSSRLADKPATLSLALNGNHAYLSGSYDLNVVEVSNASMPRTIGTYDDTTALGIATAISGTRAYVAQSGLAGLGLSVIDVSAPSQPVHTGVVSLTDFPSGLAANGNYAYVADFSAGMRIIDASNLAQPFEAGFFLANDFVFDVAAQGNLAYVAAGSEGLRIVEVSNPSAPKEIGAIQTGGFAAYVAVEGNFAYVLDFFSDLLVIDVSNPSQPVKVGFAAIGAQPAAIAIVDNWVLVGDRFSGLYVFRNDLVTSVQERPENMPARFALEQNYPNPFNPSTTIRYTLPQAGRVTLKVFDLSGKEILTLVDKWQPAGRHQIPFAAKSLASGVYLYKLEAGEFSLTRKLSLVR